VQYRAEVDGLRALAVLPVIFFHAGFEWFSGGFIGVDVFFVISGYLITTIIISEMAEGKFSIVNFYERRARRILPALFFVMAACLPFAWLWLTPNDLKDFGQSLIAVSTFSSNILFWLESGYFDTASELKPLLHTWSLAVEEQYYILFPIFLMLTWKLGVKWILIFLLITFFVSLGVAQWSSYNSPSAAFFLLPTRGWELLVGVFVAFYLKYKTHLKSNTVNQVLSLLGFGMIAYSIIFFNELTPFPSLYALIPTIGTGLLILCTVPKTFIYKLLSLKFIVGIGLISYSSYLWHQPLLAFARHRFLGDVSDLILIFLIFLSMIMAWFSMKFVEAPFRKKDTISSKNILISSCAGLLTFFLIGLLFHTNSHTIRKIDDEINRMDGIASLTVNATSECHAALSGNDLSLILEVCKIGSTQKETASFAIIGDSHARALVPGIDNHAKQLEISGFNFTHNSCFPSFADSFYLPKDEVQQQCAKARKNIKTILKQGEMPSLVFLAARWAITLEQDRFNNMEGGEEEGNLVTLSNSYINELDYLYEDAIRADLLDTVSIFKSANIKSVLIGQIPEVGWNTLRYLQKFHLFNDQNELKNPMLLSTSYKVFKQRNIKVNDMFNSINNEVDISVFFPETIFCDTKVLSNRCITQIEGDPLYYDDDHVSIKGSNMIGEALLNNYFK